MGVAVVDDDDPSPAGVATLMLVDEVSKAEVEVRDVDTGDADDEVTSPASLVAVLLTTVPVVLAPASEARVPLSPSDEESASS